MKEKQLGMAARKAQGIAPAPSPAGSSVPVPPVSGEQPRPGTPPPSGASPAIIAAVTLSPHGLPPKPANPLGIPLRTPTPTAAPVAVPSQTSDSAPAPATPVPSPSVPLKEAVRVKLSDAQLEAFVDVSISFFPLSISLVN